MTASVTRDPKRAKIRKYWPREELGSSTERRDGPRLVLYALTVSFPKTSIPQIETGEVIGEIP